MTLFDNLRHRFREYEQVDEGLSELKAAVEADSKNGVLKAPALEEINWWAYMNKRFAFNYRFLHKGIEYVPPPAPHLEADEARFEAYAEQIADYFVKCLTNSAKKRRTR